MNWSRDFWVSQEEQKHLLPVTVQAVSGLRSRHCCCCCVLHLAIFLYSRLCSPACCSWTREGGLWNFGMFIVDLVRALTNNRCLMQANTNISWHATLLTWICKGLSPLNLQTQIITDFGAGVLPSNTSMQTRESGWLYEINAQKNKWRRGECRGFCFVLL